MSTPSPEQRDPAVVRVGDKKPGAGKAPGGKKPSGNAGARKGQKKTMAPVKVAGARNWGAIGLFGGVGVLAVGIIAAGVYFSAKAPGEVRADKIKGMVSFWGDKTLVKGSNHQQGALKYAQSPPVAGPHNPRWQNCTGDVYSAPIASEHAVHSMEHGAIWITYRPDLPKDQVDKLAGKVRGRDRMMLSPYPNLDAAVSIQAWGYQLKLPSANDPRVNEFIKALRGKAGVENATCAEGITSTGTAPVDLPTTPQG